VKRGQILEQVCEVTGYTRKYALTLLENPPPDEPSVKRTRHRSATYGPVEVELLRLCWPVQARKRQRGVIDQRVIVRVDALRAHHAVEELYGLAGRVVRLGISGPSIAPTPIAPIYAAKPAGGSCR
jgi:hypothetical protein